MKYIKYLGVNLFVLFTLITLFLAAQFNNPNLNEKGNSNTIITPVPDSQFIIGAFFNAKDISYQYQSAYKFNTWHSYSGPEWGWYDNTDDHYNKNINLYMEFVKKIIDSNNNGHNMRTLMNRPIFEYLI